MHIYFKIRIRAKYIGPGRTPNFVLTILIHYSATMLTEDYNLAEESYSGSEESSSSSMEHNPRDSLARLRKLFRPSLSKFCIGGSFKPDKIEVVMEDKYGIKGPCSLSELGEVGERGRSLLTNFCPYEAGLVSVVQRILGPYALSGELSKGSSIQARLKTIERDSKDSDKISRRCTDGFGRLLVVLPTSSGSKFCPTSESPLAHSPKGGK